MEIALIQERSEVRKDIATGHPIALSSLTSLTSCQTRIATRLESRPGHPPDNDTRRL
jgi:hypothetical protein